MSYLKFFNLCILILLLLLLCNCVFATTINDKINTCYCVIVLLQQQQNDK